MANFNKVLLLGNMTRDPQLRYLPSTNTAVVDFGLAVNRKYRTAAGEDREEVTFVDCSAFARSAEVINQYCTKGRPIFIEGRLKLDTWEDKNGGGKRSKISVVVESFQLLGSRGDAPGGGGGGAPAGGQYEPDPAYESGPPPQQQQRAPMNRGPAPQRGPASGGSAAPARPAAAPPPQQAEPPFGDDPKFTEEEIPF
jgi:single-strand DNA-binding protein